jgi:hypothetical protein
MNDDAKKSQEDYLWVITETISDNESILGMASNEVDKFIPATKSKDEALILMGRMPPAESGERQVEAIHKDRLMQRAAEDGYTVYLVDQTGRVIQSITPDKVN